jgi:hypothetical protein
VRRAAERALEQADTAMNMLQREASRIGEENVAMVQQNVDLTRNSKRPRTPRRTHDYCGGSGWRCSTKSPPASWRRHDA